jgi:hypothetical protein
MYKKDIVNEIKVKSASEKVWIWDSERGEMNIDDIDEMQVNNIHLENFHPYDCERAL